MSQLLLAALATAFEKHERHRRALRAARRAAREATAADQRVRELALTMRQRRARARKGHAA